MADAPVPDYVADDVIAMLERTSTGQVCDAMDELGLPRHACMGMHAVSSVRTVAGRAFPVLFGPLAHAEPLAEYILSVCAGDALVLANGGRDDCAVWGGRRSLSAQRRGARATFIDGACRDVPEHLAVDYPVFAKHVSPVRSHGVVTPVALGIPVAFAGVVVFRGDVVVGDTTGTVIVPASRARDVALAANRIRAFEEENTDRLRTE